MIIPENESGMTYDMMKATVTVEVAENGHSWQLLQTLLNWKGGKVPTIRL